MRERALPATVVARSSRTRPMGGGDLRARRIVARLPYVLKGGRGLRMLTQSSLTHTLGPWVGPKPTPTPLRTPTTHAP